MTEFTVGDWIFIGGVMVVIVVCIAISDLRMRK
jgi:tRNA G37 N-methylase TrmD